MNLLQQLLNDRQSIAGVLQGHLQTMDLVIDRLSALDGLLGAGQGNGASHAKNGHAAKNGHTFRRVAGPMLNGHAAPNGGAMSSRDAITIAAQKAWRKSTPIIDEAMVLRGGTVTRASLLTTISTMAKDGGLDRRGDQGSYEYRAKKSALRDAIRNVAVATHEGDGEGLSGPAAVMAATTPARARKPKTLDEALLAVIADKWLRTFVWRREAAALLGEEVLPNAFKVAMLRLRRLKQVDRRGKKRGYEWHAKAVS